MNMAVEADGSQFEPEYESDWDETFQEPTEQAHMMECSPKYVNDTEGEHMELMELQPGPSGQNEVQPTVQQKRQKIHELDAEMRVRMVKLHSMMKKQGLDE